MSIRSVECAVGARNVPDVVRRLSTVPRLDYGDAFTVTTDALAAPEQWARAIFGNVPNARQTLIWRRLLGFRLRPGRSPTTVAGWPIADCGEDWIRLENASWFLTGNLVVHTGGGRVSLATFLSYDRLLGRVMWPPLSVIHRRLVPGLLAGAVARVASTPRGSTPPQERLRCRPESPTSRRRRPGRRRRAWSGSVRGA